MVDFVDFTERNVYRETAQRRKQQEIAQKRQRWERGQKVAQEGAKLLFEHGATEVILFGSALECDRFTLTSDLDLAVKGLPPEQFFTIVARLQDLSPEFKIDLVQLEFCSPSLLHIILSQGKPL